MNVLPQTMVSSCSKPAATIMDNKPFVNIMPFGICSNPANPAVASATAAALGVLTPMPCIPVISAPWSPGSPVIMIKGNPALTDSSMLMCAYGGIIKINFAGQVTVQI